MDKVIKMKKIFVSDYDGTLFQNGVVTDRDLKAIERFRAQGGLFGIATGRIVETIRHEIDKYDIPIDFLIGANGSVILDRDYNVLETDDMDVDAALEVFDFLSTKDMLYYGISDGFKIHALGESAKIYEGFDMDYESVIKGPIRGIYGLVTSRDITFEICNAINENFSHVIKAMPNFQHFDVVGLNTDKKHAIDRLLKHYNFVGQVATAGDAHNDLEMLGHYRGYAMKHADPEILDVIDRTVHNIDEAIEDFMNHDK